jgi:hypothetical protein
MSGRGTNFLEDRIQRNVIASDRSESPEKAKELAANCGVDACTLGITFDDMWLEWGSIESIIYDTMHSISIQHWSSGRPSQRYASAV